jgi:hypothetical protein
MTIGVLVSHHSHVSWARRCWPEAVIIAREQIIIQLYPLESIRYFYPASRAASESEELVVYLASNWYRNHDGMDRVQVNGFSVPQVLTGSIRIGLASQIRDFQAVEHWQSQLTKLYVSNFESTFTKNALDLWPSMVEYYEPPNKDLPHSRWLEQRQLREYLSIQRKWATPMVLKAAYVFQRYVFRSTRVKSKVTFSDWTNLFQSVEQPTLWTNHRDLRKSALVFASKRSIYKSEKLVDEQDISFLDPDWISMVLRRGAFDVSQNLAELLALYIQNTVEKSKKIIAIFHAQVSSLFGNYDIDLIQVPAELFEPYVVALQLAQSCGIQSRLQIDGHDPTGEGIPTLRTSEDSEYLLDQFVVASELLYVSAKLKGFQDSQIIKGNSPFHSIHQIDDRIQQLKYDAIVMTWICNHQNPEARIDYSSKTLETSLKLLATQFNGKIAVKLKDYLLEHDYVELVIQSLGLAHRVELLSGQFSNHVKSTGLIIGGISSAIAEAMIQGVPYIIFEPAENGYSNKIFEHFPALDVNRIARNSSDLRKLILEGRSSVEVSGREYLYSLKDQ